MSASGVRDLSPEERALVSGGAQVDTTDLPPVDVTPPDDWGPNPDPPDWPDPWDPGDGGGGETTFSSNASIDGNGVASATQTWVLQDYNLTFNLTENLNLTNGNWGLAGNGSFQYAGQTYTLGLTTDHFNVSNYNASFNQDFGNGVSFNIGLTFDPNTNSFTGQFNLVISGF
ncbi:hypothetical protein [Stenotrophomonas maltophilia]|uniref:hypothetical protein n=1 Tax=Stenotrophomonas maltophilia TaxID=40324 RepID=UPI0013DD18AF|nr:hypothetical protein [Stenotrophomonas maltophilia]